MKSLFASLLCLGLSVLAYQARAECPSSLNAEQMQECIVSENAGYYYSPRETVTSVDDAPIASTANSNTEPTVSNQTIVAAKDKLQHH